MFPETGEASADGRPKRFYERDAILLSLRAQGEAIDAHPRAALDAGSRCGQSQGKDLERRGSADLPPRITRPVRPIFSYSPPKG